MNNKIYSFLGLMQKAGKILSGDETVSNEIKNKKCKLLIIANDASDNTKDRFQNMVKNYETKYIYFGEKEKLGYCIGKSQRTVISIRDEKVAESLIEKLQEQQLRG